MDSFPNLILIDTKKNPPKRKGKRRERDGGMGGAGGEKEEEEGSKVPIKSIRNKTNDRADILKYKK